MAYHSRSPKDSHAYRFASQTLATAGGAAATAGCDAAGATQLLPETGGFGGFGGYGGFGYSRKEMDDL